MCCYIKGGESGSFGLYSGREEGTLEKIGSFALVTSFKVLFILCRSNQGASSCYRVNEASVLRYIHMPFLVEEQ